MSNREFHGKCVHFNVIPNSDENDQRIVSEPLVHEIAPCHVTTTTRNTGMTAPQEPSPLSRKECAQQAYTSHVTTYQYPNSNVMPGQECFQLHITSTPGHIPYLHQNQLQPYLQQCKESTPNDVVTQYLQQHTLNQSQLNDTLGSILNNQQSLQIETISMMNEMSKSKKQTVYL